MTRLEIAMAFILRDGPDANIGRCFDAAERVLAEESRREQREKELREKSWVSRMQPNGTYRYGPPLESEK